MQMVTADNRALVCVWDVVSGEKVMEFNANQSAEYIECEVTAMTFDPSYRRLLTSLNDSENNDDDGEGVIECKFDYDEGVMSSRQSIPRVSYDELEVGFSFILIH